jgi:DNA-binding MarR family transcriptional regulator
MVAASFLSLSDILISRYYISTHLTSREKRAIVCPVAEREDHVDRFLAELEPVEGLDLEVEGIVDRIGGLERRLKRAMDATLSEFGLSMVDFKALGALRNSGARTPGKLGRYLELSSGAMTSRLDALEGAGLVRRLPDPNDRRSVLVEITDEGRAAYERAVSTQARKEAFFASALTPSEQRRLNALLRKLMLAFESAEASADGRRS